jgi:hypothetical protein
MHNPVSRQWLEAIAGEPEPARTTQHRTTTKRAAEDFNLEQWLHTSGLDIRRTKPIDGGGTLWEILCPWRESDGYKGWVSQDGSGVIRAGCRHDTCPGSNADEGNAWRSLRSLIEPNRDQRTSTWTPPAHTQAPPPDDDPIDATPTRWNTPAPLERGDRRPLDTSILPKPIAAYVDGLAAQLQVPPDSVLMQVLAALGTAAARYIYIECADGWQEPLNIYTVVVLDPGERKTATSNEASKPVYHLEKLLEEALADTIKNRFIDRAIWQDEIDSCEADLKTKGPRAKTGAEKRALINCIADRKKDLEDNPAYAKPCLLSEDATPEALRDLVIEQGGRIGIITDEGGGLFAMFTGMYGNKSNFEIALRGHDGGKPLRVRRVGNKVTMEVERPLITMGLCVQTSVITELAKHPELQGRGLLARFLYAVPLPKVGWRHNHPPRMDPAVKYLYEKIVCDIGGVAATPALADNPAVLRLSGEAQQLFDDYRQGIERRLRGDGDLATMTGWGSKLSGQIGRIAGLFHMATHGIDGIHVAVDPDTMRSAIGLSDYLVAHALVAGSMMGEMPGVHDARKIIKWLEDARDSGAPVPMFSQSDAQRKTHLTAEELVFALELLVNSGWLKKTAGVTPKGTQRRDARSFVPHPLLTGDENGSRQ